MRFFRWIARAALVALSFPPVAAFAYEVSPMRIMLSPSEGRTSAVIAVNNNEKEALPIEIKILRRAVSADGTQAFADAEKDFVVFPPQVQIPANKSQAVRIQYVGPARLTETQGYVIQVTEVPVVPPGFSGVKFAYNFGVAVYVKSPRAVERLSVTSATASGGKLNMEVRNEGSDWGLINNKLLAVSAGSATRELAPSDFADSVGNPLVPPNSTRSFLIDASGIPDGPAKVTLRDADG